MFDVPGDCGEDFLDWGKRWTNGTEAQLTMRKQWDKLLHHLME